MDLINNKFTIDEFSMDIIIPHLNYIGLRKELETLRKHTPSHVINKVILIDQNPSGYQEVDDLVDIHARTKDIGFSSACNLGARISRSDFLMFLNDDVEFLNKRWIGDCIEVFNRFGKQVLAVNPASIRNPISSGGEPKDWEGFPPHDDWTDEEYNRAKQLDIGKYVYDTICTWGTIFNRYKLEKVESVIPNKCFFDESMWSGQDYKLNRDAYMTKNEDNDFRGYRLLGGGGVVRHLWYSTKDEKGAAKVKYDPTFNKMYGIWENGEMKESPDLFGNKGVKHILKNIIRE